jgi:hypothetical protein
VKGRKLLFVFVFIFKSILSSRLLLLKSVCTFACCYFSNCFAVTVAKKIDLYSSILSLVAIFVVGVAHVAVLLC